MGSSTQTASLLLPQFSDNDKPTWRGDINSAFAAIDSAHVTMASTVASHTSELAVHDSEINANTLNIAANATAIAGKVSKGALVFNVKDYGAKGDSVTDDTAAIQAAINAAIVNAGGGILFFPAGVYNITATLTFTNASGITVLAPRAGLQGGWTNRAGAWLYWAGDADGALDADDVMVNITGCQNVSWTGLGLHGNNNAKGILIRSGAGNTPVSTVHAYRDFHIFRCSVGMHINDAGDASQTDQILCQSIRMDEIVQCPFILNSRNVSTCRFERCTTAIANSNTDSVHFNIISATQTYIVNCNAGYGQDFVRLGSLGQVTTVEGSQFEGTTHATPAFLRVGATTDGGFVETTNLRGNVIDEPVVLAGPSRVILSMGNLFHPGVTVTLSGSNTQFLSYGEVQATTPVVTGTNAMFRQIDAPIANGGKTPTLSMGASGSTAASITGNAYAGSISLTTAAGLAADAYCVVVVPTTQIPAGYNVALTPTNAAAAAAMPFVTGKFASQWVINLHNPPATATPMTFDYIIR